MQKIPLRLARPGMTLAQPLMDAEGRMLVGVGAELTEGVIARLEAAGIRSLSIRGAMSPGASFRGQALGRLDHLFRKRMDDRFMAALKTMLEEYLKQHVAREKIGADL